MVNEYENVGKPLNQSLPFICTHEGDCTDCSCVSNRTYCRDGCNCSSTCARRFPRCDCNGRCDESTCLCIQTGYECIANRCADGHYSTDTCCNVLEGRPDAEVMVKISTVAHAGKGLVAEASIKEGSYVGEYRGKIVLNELENGGKVSLFRVSQDASVEGNTTINQMFYINHQEKSTNVRFSYIEGPTYREVVVFAVRAIEVGEELLVHYGDSVNWDFPLATSPSLADYRLNGYTYVLGDEGNKEQFWVAKILEFYSPRKVLVQWTENPAHLPWKAQEKNAFGEHELLITFDEDNQAEIDTETLAGDITVYEHSKDPGTGDFWWNRFWYKGRVTAAYTEAPVEFDDDDYQ